MMRKSNLTGLILLALLFACKPLPVVDNGSDDQESPGTTEDALKQIAAAYYPFDDETARSTTKNLANGVLLGNPSFISDTPSGKGKALFLNGIKEQCVNIPYALFAGLKYFTVSFWVKDFSTGSVVSGIYASDYNNADWQYYPRVYFTAEGKISFTCGNGYYLSTSPTFSYSYSAIQSNNWHHIAVTCSNGVLELFVDGNYTDKINSNWSDSAETVPKVQIGGNGNGIYPVFFSGKVDNVAIYKKVLNSIEIKFVFDNKL